MSDPLTERCPDSVCQAAPGRPCNNDCSSHWDADPTNTERAEYAGPPLQAFADAAYHSPGNRDLTDPGAADQAARDLISNLCHHLDRLDINPGVVLHRAYDVYRQEHREDAPGERRPTAFTLACDDCGAAPGTPCAWGCSSWGIYGTTWHRVGTPEQPSPSPNGQPTPAPGYAVVETQSLHRSPLPETTTTIRFRFEVSEEATYTLVRELDVPTRIAADADQLAEYALDNFDGDDAADNDDADDYGVERTIHSAEPLTGEDA